MNLTSTRFFGIEIECKDVTMEQARDAIVASGIPCRIESYGHSTPTSWKIVTDSSVYNGFEVVSPKLSGNDGLEQVKKVAQALNQIGARVARDCGFHVHVDATNLNACTLHNILVRYAAYESTIDTLMPRSRRANENRFCRSTTEILGYLRVPEGRHGVRDYLSSIDSDQRYYKVNVAAYLRHQTVEFRQHSGTTMATKMIPWIIFCINFVEKSIVTINVTTPPGTSNIPEEPPVLAGTRTNSVIRKFHALARVLFNTDRFRYATIEQIARALGCGADSVPSYISRFREAYPRFEIKVRRGRGYYLNIFYPEDRREFLNFLGVSPDVGWHDATVGPPPVYELIHQEDTGPFDGLDNDVISYFQERAVELAQ